MTELWNVVLSAALPVLGTVVAAWLAHLERRKEEAREREEEEEAAALRALREEQQALREEARALQGRLHRLELALEEAPAEASDRDAPERSAGVMRRRSP